MTRLTSQEWYWGLTGLLLTAVGWLVWNYMDERLDNCHTYSMETRELASRAMSIGQEAHKAALTARPDPYTGADGREDKQEVKDLITATAAAIRAEDERDQARIKTELTHHQKDIETLLLWHEEDQRKELECAKEREGMKAELRELRKWLELTMPQSNLWLIPEQMNDIQIE